jgi:hypothetical protein
MSNMSTLGVRGWAGGPTAPRVRNAPSRPSPATGALEVGTRKTLVFHQGRKLSGDNNNFHHRPFEKTDGRNDDHVGSKKQAGCLDGGHSES